MPIHTKTDKAKRLPPWLRRQIGKSSDVREVKNLLRRNHLNTVCEEARCPNLTECFEKKRATFLILGNLCTRDCGFCSVEGGRPLPPDPEEPQKVAEAARRMGTKYVVVTSVTRDDLEDGGASHFSGTIREIRRAIRVASIEVLTPDFMGSKEAIDTVCQAGPDVYNHNMETVPSRYHEVRPSADYRRSLGLIRYIKERYPRITTKSGIMLGLGEKKEEVIQVLHDLKLSGCDLVTIGQYMRPTRAHLEVKEYVELEVFKELEEAGRKIGFRGVYSGPLVRSSFNAEHFRKEVGFGRILQN